MWSGIHLSMHWCLVKFFVCLADPVPGTVHVHRSTLSCVCVSFVGLTIQRTICVCVWSVCYLISEAQRGFNHESSGLASIIAVLWTAYTSHRGAWHLDCKALLTHQRLEWKKRKKCSGVKLSKHDIKALCVENYKPTSNVFSLMAVRKYTLHRY